MAELAAMRARGDVDQSDFEAARDILRQRYGVTVGDLRSNARATEVYGQAEPNPEAAKLLKTKPGAGETAMGCGTMIVISLLLGFALTHCGGSTSKTDVAEDHRKGFHCLSAWDGSDSALVAKVNENLRDPSSFEHVETRISPVDSEGNHRVVMEYRARNGFGGLNVSIAKGTIRNSDCALIDWSLQ
ncbi:MAG: hypothetical protein ABIQ51_22850 [Mesorhizobium sp.]